MSVRPLPFRSKSKLLKPAPVCFSLRCSRKKMDVCRSAVHRDLLRAQGCGLLSTQASSPTQSCRGPRHAAQSGPRPFPLHAGLLSPAGAHSAARSAHRTVRPAPASTSANLLRAPSSREAVRPPPSSRARAQGPHGSRPPPPQGRGLLPAPAQGAHGAAPWAAAPWAAAPRARAVLPRAQRRGLLLAPAEGRRGHGAAPWPTAPVRLARRGAHRCEDQ